MFINERTAPVLDKYKSQNVVIKLSKNKNITNPEYNYLITICDGKTKSTLETLPVTPKEMQIARAQYRRQQQEAIKQMEIMKHDQKVMDAMSAKSGYID